MTTLEGTLATDAMATDTAILSKEVPDYSSVPPAVAHSPPEAPSGVNLSNVQVSSRPFSKEWDYGKKGGADFNMEAPILAEDVIRAGGLGARDELDSFLPSAVDATDYEESLKDAMEYEDVQPAVEGEIPRPGVGFVKAEQEHMDGFRDVRLE